MAWISVHESVLSTKLRLLAKEIACSQNEALGILVRLWLWGINNADSDGIINGAGKDDLQDVLNIGLAQGIDAGVVVEALIATNWIEYEEAKIRIHNWDLWQRQWYAAIERRKRDRSRKANAKAKEPAKTVALVQPEIMAESPKEKVKPYPEDFETFWSVYPRKVGKGEAYKCYKARIADGWKPKDLAAAAKRYGTEVVKNRTEVTYIKHPKTFLSAATPFTDYLNKQDELTKPINEADPFSDWR